MTLAKGTWDKLQFSQENKALAKVADMISSGSTSVALSFTNVYETSKINLPLRRANLAHLQSLMSGGIVFRGRRRVLAETLAAVIAEQNGISRHEPRERWFLS